MSASGSQDLLILTADFDTSSALEALLKRRKSLGIRAITYRVIRHPHRDPGVYLHAHEFLRPFQSQFERALAICDHHGCGADASPRSHVEEKLRGNIQSSGWGDRGDAVVISPELEQWVWGPSNHIPRILGWEGSYTALKTFLIAQRYWHAGEPKPHEPKLALQAALKESMVPFSASIFTQLASTVSWRGCRESSFVSLCAILHRWFAISPQIPEPDALYPEDQS